ncbi:MAG: hypothetical protein ACRDA4_08090 [Filifactoraceae bacterium]
MDNPFNKKIEIELTLHELEEIIIMLRVANKVVTGEIRSEIEEKLQNICSITKYSYYCEGEKVLENEKSL